MTVARPDWPAVEALLSHLVTTRATFATAVSHSNKISRYEPGWRLLLETDQGARWVDVASIRGCWETFERLGRIRRADVLEPGRCSAFIMALFEQLNGVDQESEGETALVFSAGREWSRETAGEAGTRSAG